MSEIARETHHPDAMIAGLKLVQNSGGGIGSAIIHVNDFELHGNIFERRKESPVRFAQYFLFVVARHHHAEQKTPPFRARQAELRRAAHAIDHSRRHVYSCPAFVEVCAAAAIWSATSVRIKIALRESL